MFLLSTFPFPQGIKEATFRATQNSQITPLQSKAAPIAGLEDPKGNRGIALLFLQLRRWIGVGG